MTTNQIPATRNEDWGFWGTMNEHAEAASPLTMTAISDATHQPLESVRIFLDSRHGRHFADDVGRIGEAAGRTLPSDHLDLLEMTRFDRGTERDVGSGDDDADLLRTRGVDGSCAVVDPPVREHRGGGGEGQRYRYKDDAATGSGRHGDTPWVGK